jgi:hypothetical protein
MSKSVLLKLGALTIILLIVGLLIYQVPAINLRLSWRLDIARTYLRNVISPVGQMPTPLPQPVAITNPNKSPH